MDVDFSDIRYDNSIENKVENFNLLDESKLSIDQHNMILSLANSTGLTINSTCDITRKTQIWTKIAETVKENFPTLPQVSAEKCMEIMKSYDHEMTFDLPSLTDVEKKFLSNSAPCLQADAKPNEFHFSSLLKRINDLELGMRKQEKTINFWQNQYFQLVDQYKTETMIMFKNIIAEVRCTNSVVAQLIQAVQPAR